MKINVYEIPNSTWVLDGDSFFCTHDEIEVENISGMHDSLFGVYETDDDYYVCAECRKILYDKGDPAEDRIIAAGELNED